LRHVDDVFDIAIATIEHFLNESKGHSFSTQRGTTMHKSELVRTLKPMLSALIRDESGQDLIEYALVAAIIALGATAAMNTLAGNITSAFNKIGTSLTSAV
jgi:pilus assembly protein Flp/PilA